MKQSIQDNRKPLEDNEEPSENSGEPLENNREPQELQEDNRVPHLETRDPRPRESLPCVTSGVENKNSTIPQ